MLSVFAISVLAFAAPPQVTALFPAGVRSGETITVLVSGKVEPWPPRIDVEGEGLQVSAAEEKGKLQVKAAPGAAPGKRWIRLYDATGASTPRPFVCGRLRELAEKEPNDSAAEATDVGDPELTVNGRLEKRGDVDSFRVQLARGARLVASVDANRSLASPMDAVLELLSPEGAVLAQNHDARGLDPEIVFVAKETGDYVVRLFAFPWPADASINLAGGDTFVYRLTLTTRAFCDHPFPPAVAASGASTVELRGWNLPEEMRRIVIAPPAAGRLDSIALEPKGVALAVRVGLVEGEVRVEGISSGGVERLPVPGAIAGHVDPPGDVDRFALALKKGEQVVLTVEARKLDSPLDPVLAVRDAGGKVLAESDDRGEDADPALDFTAPADGDFQVSVRDLFGAGSWRHLYLLRAERPRPGFEARAQADSFAVAAGASVEIAVAIDRRRGYPEEIEVAAEGLPPGLTGGPVTSPASGDAAKSVKLKLTADAGAQAFSGAFRILARSKGPQPIERRASASLPVAGERTERLWLTVTGAK